MGTYENGDETKAHILDACEKLFLEKGYAATTFLDICKEAHVNQGSIYYHFKEKNALFRQVADRINEKNRALALKVLPSGAPAYMQFLLDIYVYWYRFFHDEKFRRLMASPGPTSSSDLDQYEGYWKHCSAFIPDFNRFFSEHALDFIVCTGIDRQLTLYISGNMEKYTWLEMAEYHVRTIALIFQYAPEQIDNILLQIQDILKDVDLHTLFDQT